MVPRLSYRKLKAFLHRMKLKRDKGAIQTRWELDYELIENEGLFEEYLEMGMGHLSVTNNPHIHPPYFTKKIICLYL